MNITVSQCGFPMCSEPRSQAFSQQRLSLAVLLEVANAGERRSGNEASENEHTVIRRVPLIQANSSACISVYCKFYLAIIA